MGILPCRKLYSSSRPPALQQLSDKTVNAVTFRTVFTLAVAYLQQVCLTPTNNFSLNTHLSLRSVTPTRNLNLTHPETSKTSEIRKKGSLRGISPLIRGSNPRGPTTRVRGQLLGFSEYFASIIIFPCDILEACLHKLACFLNVLSNSDVELVFSEVDELGVHQC